MDGSLLDFFQIPDDLEAPFSRRSTPGISLQANNEATSTTGNKAKNYENGVENGMFKSHKEKDDFEHNFPLRSKSADDIENTSQDDNLGDFSLEKMENDCR